MADDVDAQGIQGTTNHVQRSNINAMPAWHDEDDDLVDDTVNVEASEPAWVRKRRKYLQDSQRQGVSWDVDSDPSTLTGKLTKLKPTKHASGVRFKIDRQNDSRHDITLAGGVKQLGFDPSNTLLAALGAKEKTVKLFRVDQHRSRGIHFRLKGETISLPSDGRSISAFSFADEGKSMLMISDHKSVVKYNVEQQSMLIIASITNPYTASGYRKIHVPHDHDNHVGRDIFALSSSDYGGVLICDGRSNSIVHHFQMNAQSIGAAFYLPANMVITADEEANIYEWDITTGKCMNKFKDDHSLHLTSFAISPTVSAEFSRNAYLTTGSRTGFLNRFPLTSERDSNEGGTTCIQGDLVKSYGNLSTAITSIATEESGTFIAYASEHKRNAIRIIHNPSSHVIGNWPTDSFNLGRITDVAFGSKYNTLAIGNRRGRVQFFRIFTT
ncbi:hypothetical protein X943_002753 [Babesia divergens]|uniref:U3 small nucleolar RNA-associated protein 18 n=1 Tax=Babesia divergens TaxID=32595 RepID=A0AAD9GFJ2_BABDI|nr:hypothetical protein X943_002753 [Babesia divergens]